MDDQNSCSLILIYSHMLLHCRATYLLPLNSKITQIWSLWTDLILRTTDHRSDFLKVCISFASNASFLFFFFFFHTTNMCLSFCCSPSRVLWGKTRPSQSLLRTWSPPATIRSTSFTRDSSKRWSSGWRSGQCLFAVFVDTKLESNRYSFFISIHSNTYCSLNNITYIFKMLGNENATLHLLIWSN